MNCYDFNDLYVGLQESFSVTVTEEMLNAFTDITGDVNPLHTDEGYAKAKGYPSKVVYGMLTASFYSTLAGVYLPGKHCLLFGVDAKFTSPVFSGDTLCVSGKVSEIRRELGFITIKAQITNKDGTKVSKATITAGVKSNEQ